MQTRPTALAALLLLFASLLQLRVDAQLPAQFPDPRPSRDPLPPSEQCGVAEVVVNSTFSGAVPTHLFASPWRTIVVSARGKSFYALPPLSGCGAACSANPEETLGPSVGLACNENRTLPGAPVGSLLYRVGTHGRFHLVGASGEIRSPVSGPLFLAYNDDFFPDNGGTYTVQLTCVRTPVPATCGRESVRVFAGASAPLPVMHLPKHSTVLLTATGTTGYAAACGAPCSANPVRKQAHKHAHLPMHSRPTWPGRCPVALTLCFAVCSVLCCGVVVLILCCHQDGGETFNNSCAADCKLPGADVGTLLYRLGRSGPFHVAGSVHAIHAGCRDRELFLVYNDDSYLDNTGSYRVDLSCLLSDDEERDERRCRDRDEDEECGCERCTHEREQRERHHHRPL